MSEEATHLSVGGKHRGCKSEALLKPQSIEWEGQQESVFALMDCAGPNAGHPGDLSIALISSNFVTIHRWQKTGALSGAGS